MSPNRIIALVASPILASTAFVMELTLVPLLLPAIQAQYGLSVGELTWFFNSYAISVALGVLVGGWFGDLFGAAKVFIFSVALFIAGGFAVALSENFTMTLLARVVQGFGGGFFSPLVPVLLVHALPDKPGKILMIWGSITGYFVAFAPLVAAPVVHQSGWQIAFFLVAAIGAVALLMLRRANPVCAPTASWRGLDIVGLFARSRLWLAFGYVFFTYGAIMLYLFRLPLLLSDAGTSTATIGFLLAVLWLSFSVAGTLLRNWVDGSLIGWIVAAAPVAIAAGFLLVHLSGGMATLCASVISIGIGIGFACSNAPSTRLVLKFAPDGLRAFSTSFDITFARLGGVLSVGILAPLAPTATLAVVICLCVAALICGLFCTKEASQTATSVVNPS